MGKPGFKMKTRIIFKKWKKREREKEKGGREKEQKLWEQEIVHSRRADFTDLVCKVTKQRNKIRNSKILGEELWRIRIQRDRTMLSKISGLKQVIRCGNK